MTEAATAQEEVFAFLGDPATHGGAAVKRIDTHAAVVFLAGDRALKAKRAVKFPFLDFSTLARRKAACEAELAINRAYAPELYRRVLPITREPDGGLALGGDGEPVEWAVEMHRFDEAQTLDHLAADGRIEPALANALGRTVARAHADAPAADAGRWIAALGAYVEEHADAFAARPEVFPAGAAEALARDGRAAYARIHPLLTARGRNGFVRRIHGDLHLGNIVRIDGRPVLFDAIEFSDLIGSGDVIYDLAFLLMDLAERDLGAAANIVLNRYLTDAGHPEHLDALAALPFFLSMRAAIRAKVTAARLDQAEADKLPEIARTARTYFDWAGRFLAPAPPRMVAIGGLSGTGKSRLARDLAPTLGAAPGAAVLRTDVERKTQFGKAETEPLPPQAYAEAVTAQVYAAAADKARRVVAAGHSAIVDAVFARPGERAAIEAAAKDIDVPFTGLFLEAGLAIRLARVGGRSHDASDADAAVARRQEDYDLGDLRWSRVDASGTPEQTLERVRTALR